MFAGKLSMHVKPNTLEEFTKTVENGRHSTRSGPASRPRES